MEIVKFIEEQIEDLDKVLEEIDETIENLEEIDEIDEIRELMGAYPNTVIWFVKYRTIRGSVCYLPCEGIKIAREWAAKLDGQIMNRMI